VSRIGAANGLVIASPEYNFSVPAVLKNAIDWVTRAKPMPLRGKTAVLLSASPSLVGGNRALWVLRTSLEVVGVHVYPDMFSLALRASLRRRRRDLKDEALGRFLRSVLSGLCARRALHRAGDRSEARPLGRQVLAFHKTLSNWGGSGARSTRHAELITPAKRAAARLVKKRPGLGA
jgi:NAD(P)H-dependent FMN reductase